jgi:hypothetical protein
MTAATMSSGVRVAAKANLFYVWMSLACVGVAFGGFAAEYWAPMVAGRLPVPAIFHIHGLIFSTWTVYLVSQATLIANGNVRLHRSMGLIGISLATAMVFAGVLIAIASIKNSASLGFGEEAKTFAVVPLLGIVVFAGMIVAAIVNVRRPEVHKRLMLVATIGILEAAVGRIFKLAFAPPQILALPLMQQPPPALDATAYLPSAATDLLLVAAIIYDWRTRGRPHPAYLIGGAVLVGLQVSNHFIGPTAAWHAIATWVVSLAG